MDQECLQYDHSHAELGITLSTEKEESQKKKRWLPMVRYCHGNERGGKKRETGNFASEQTDTSTQTGPRVALFFSHLALIKIYIYVSINLYRKISLDTKAADS